MKRTRLLLLLLCLLCTLLLTACYQEIDPWPEAPAQTVAPTAVPEATHTPTDPPLTQPGLNG